MKNSFLKKKTKLKNYSWGWVCHYETNSRCLGTLDKVVHAAFVFCLWAPTESAAFVPPVSSVDLQVVEVVQRGAQSPAWLHVVHFLGQLGARKKKKKTQHQNHSNAFCIYWNKKVTEFLCQFTFLIHFLYRSFFWRGLVLIIFKVIKFKHVRQF